MVLKHSKKPPQGQAGKHQSNPVFKKVAKKGTWKRDRLILPKFNHLRLLKLLHILQIMLIYL